MTAVTAPSHDRHASSSTRTLTQIWAGAASRASRPRPETGRGSHRPLAVATSRGGRRQQPPNRARTAPPGRDLGRSQHPDGERPEHGAVQRRPSWPLAPTPEAADLPRTTTRAPRRRCPSHPQPPTPGPAETDRRRRHERQPAKPSAPAPAARDPAANDRHRAAAPNASAPPPPDAANPRLISPSGGGEETPPPPTPAGLCPAAHLGGGEGRMGKGADARRRARVCPPPVARGRGRGERGKGGER